MPVLIIFLIPVAGILIASAVSHFKKQKAAQQALPDFIRKDWIESENLRRTLRSKGFPVSHGSLSSMISRLVKQGRIESRESIAEFQGVMQRTSYFRSKQI